MKFNLKSGVQKKLESRTNFKLSDLEFDLEELSDQDCKTVTGGNRSKSTLKLTLKELTPPTPPPPPPITPPLTIIPPPPPPHKGEGPAANDSV